MNSSERPQAWPISLISPRNSYPEVKAAPKSTRRFHCSTDVREFVDTAPSRALCRRIQVCRCQLNSGARARQHCNSQSSDRSLGVGRLGVHNPASVSTIPVRENHYTQRGTCTTMANIRLQGNETINKIVQMSQLNNQHKPTKTIAAPRIAPTSPTLAPTNPACSPTRIIPLAALEVFAGAGVPDPLLVAGAEVEAGLVTEGEERGAVVAMEAEERGVVTEAEEDTASVVADPVTETESEKAPLDAVANSGRQYTWVWIG